jgi:type II restriction enzyme
VKNIDYFERTYKCSTIDSAFAILISTLNSYYGPDYYVDWNKVHHNIAQIEVELAILSTLCGKQDVRTAAVKLFEQYPHIAKALPILIATRGDVNIVSSYDDGTVNTYRFDEPNRKSTLSLGMSTSSLAAEPRNLWTKSQAELYADFIVETGVVDMLGKLKDVVDYARGVEVGLDSNTRKNRSGKSAVFAFQPCIDSLAKRFSDLGYIPEATYLQVSNLGIQLPNKYSDVRWDFVLYNKRNPRNMIFAEINHYGTQGSKPSAISREYTERYRELKQHGLEFLWVTDGLGWNKMKVPLFEAFHSIEHVTTIKLARDGYLDHIVTNVIL